MRELKNVIRKAALLPTDLITPEFLPPWAAPREAGKQESAARLLPTDYTTPHAKMKRFNISAREFLRS